MRNRHTSEAQEAGGIGGHQHGPGFKPTNGGEELPNLISAENDWQAFGNLGTGQLFEWPVLAQRDAKEEVQSATGLIVRVPGPPQANQMQQVLADMFLGELIGRAVEVLGELGDSPNVSVLGVDRHVPHSEVIEQTLAQWCHRSLQEWRQEPARRSPVPFPRRCRPTRSRAVVTIG